MSAGHVKAEVATIEGTPYEMGVQFVDKVAGQAIVKMTAGMGAQQHSEFLMGMIAVVSVRLADVVGLTMAEELVRTVTTILAREAAEPSGKGH